ncbi:MAG: SRPBCC family protein [Prevotella sp.]|nr:SRPBCC family protein [Prevotella sp.]MCM1074997.1 SRPBCC family protein [Ruminococcus sp.]
MATEYKSKPTILAAPIEKVYGRFSNLENLKNLIDNVPEDKLPADKLEQLKKMEVTPDSITVQGGPTGAVTLEVVERIEPSLISLKPVGIPMDLQMQLRFEDLGAETQATAAIVADIPMMLRPMLKGPLQQIVDQFAAMMAAIPF